MVNSQGLDSSATPTRDEAVRELLRELHAVVIGECPSLLNEDSGGNADLALRIEEALASAPAPASGGVGAVDWKALFEAAHGALICIGQMQGDAEYARTTADALTVASLSPAATPVSEAEPVAEAEIARLKRINAEHCAAINSLNVESAALEDKLRDVQHRLLIRARAAEDKLAALAKPASSPAGGDVDWKSLFETAHGALICIAEAQADAHYARKVADELTDATLSQSTSAGRVGE